MSCMSLETIAAKVRTFFCHYLRDTDFSDEDDVFASGQVNSLMAMQLVLFVEKEFAIKVTNEDLDLANFNSVLRVARFVEKKLAS